MEYIVTKDVPLLLETSVASSWELGLVRPPAGGSSRLSTHLRALMLLCSGRFWEMHSYWWPREEFAIAANIIPFSVVKDLFFFKGMGEKGSWE